MDTAYGGNPVRGAGGMPASKVSCQEEVPACMAGPMLKAYMYASVDTATDTICDSSPALM